MKYYKIFIVLIVVAVLGTAFGVMRSLCYEPTPAYRPMIFYNGKLFWDERSVETQPDAMEYIGTVNSVVAAGKKPSRDFECNSQYFMGGKLYYDDCGNYYLCRTNGELLLLKTAGAGCVTNVTQYQTVISTNEF